jgi:DNA repair protein RecN (Recombination protein N)
LQVLKAVGQHLVDLHGPHEHQSLNSRERQLAMLDAAAGAERALEAYEAAWRGWRRIGQELDELSRSEAAGTQELELLRYQVEEIDAAGLRVDEEEPLLQRHRMAANGTRLAELAVQAVGLLGDGEQSVLVQLGELRRVFRDLERTDRGAAVVTAPFEAAFMELEDLERALRRYQDGLEIDPREVAELEERINLIETMKRKYGGTVERVLDHRDAAAAKLGRMEGRGEELERLGAALVAARAAVETAGTALSQLRRKAAPRLAREVSRHLADLGFREAKFSVELAPLGQPGGAGLEEAEFMFAPNPGEPAKALRVIASSGEMSRVMLAVKSALAKEDNIPLLVFDEIDANVGGEIAAAVGRKMRELGSSHQIISITHMPQVAALAASHYLVTKVVEGGRTHSELTAVSGAARVDEIARMLGGRAASARAHAESLLSGGE